MGFNRELIYVKVMLGTKKVEWLRKEQSTVVGFFLLQTSIQAEWENAYIATGWSAVAPAVVA